MTLLTEERLDKIFEQTKQDPKDLVIAQWMGHMLLPADWQTPVPILSYSTEEDLDIINGWYEKVMQDES